MKRNIFLNKGRISILEGKNFRFCLWFLCLLVFGNISHVLAQEKIVAIVNNNIITQKELHDFVDFMRLQLSAEYKGAELEKTIQSMLPDLLNKLIEDRLIVQEARKNKITVDESRVKAKVDEIKKRYASETEFQGALAAQGIVQADIESRIREQLLILGVIETQVRSKVTVAPAEVTQFYQKNLEEFKVPQQRKFETLMLSSKDLAQEIYRCLKEGQSWQEVAQKYSLEANKMEVYEGTELRKDIEAVVFQLGIAELSEPVKIEDKYYIFKLNSVTPSRQRPLSEVQDSIYEIVFNNKMQEELTRWLDGIKKQSYIKILQD